MDGKNANTRGVEETLRDAAKKLEAELQQAVAYINDRVIPDVRKHSSEGLRLAAQNLHRLAEALERHRG